MAVVEVALDELTPLPPPGPSQLEIRFRRLLHRCAARAQRGDGGVGVGVGVGGAAQPTPYATISSMDSVGAAASVGIAGGDGVEGGGNLASSSSSAPWRSDPKFHAYVDALRELLYDLETAAGGALSAAHGGMAGGGGGPGPDVLAAYREHVGWFARELRPPDVPAFCRRLGGPRGGGGAADAAGAAAAESAAAAASTADALVTPARGSVDGGGGGQQQLARRMLRDGPSSTSGAPSSSSEIAAVPPPAGESTSAAGGVAGGGSSGPGFVASAATRAAVETQRRLQDELAEDMLGLTAEMRAGALAMQNAIRYRGKLLDATETNLVDSTANARSVAAKAKERHRAGRSGFCWTLAMLLVVSLVFAVMMVYIKATSMVGITGRRRRPRVPPPTPRFAPQPQLQPQHAWG